MSIDAMKQALEALEILNNEVIYDGAVQINVDVEITALRAAIAEASMQRLTDVQQEMEHRTRYHLEDGTPLYTHPPRREWVGLTDGEIAELHYDIKAQFMGTFKIEAIYRALEAKLKEKNS